MKLCLPIFGCVGEHEQFHFRFKSHAATLPVSYSATNPKPEPFSYFLLSSVRTNNGVFELGVRIMILLSSIDVNLRRSQVPNLSPAPLTTRAASGIKHHRVDGRFIFAFKTRCKTKMSPLILAQNDTLFLVWEVLVCRATYRNKLAWLVRLKRHKNWR